MPSITYLGQDIANDLDAALKNLQSLLAETTVTWQKGQTAVTPAELIDEYITRYNQITTELHDIHDSEDLSVPPHAPKYEVFLKMSKRFKDLINTWPKGMVFETVVIDGEETRVPAKKQIILEKTDAGVIARRVGPWENGDGKKSMVPVILALAAGLLAFTAFK